MEKKSIHRLLRCKTCEKGNLGCQTDKIAPRLNSPCIINRDANSCLNMLYIVNHVLNDKEHKRPPVFTRGTVLSTSKKNVHQLSFPAF